MNTGVELVFYIPVSGRQAAHFRIKIGQEEDGRWIAEVPELPGAMVYGSSREEAIAKVESLVLRVIADRLDHGEQIPELHQLFDVAA